MNFSLILSFLILVNFSTVFSQSNEDDDNIVEFSKTDKNIEYWSKFGIEMEDEFYELLNLEEWEYLETEEESGDEIYTRKHKGILYYRTLGEYDCNTEMAYNASYLAQFGDTSNDICVFEVPEEGVDICYEKDEEYNDRFMVYRSMFFNDGVNYFLWKSVENGDHLPLEEFGISPSKEKSMIIFGIMGKEFRPKEDDPNATKFDSIYSNTINVEESDIIHLIKSDGYMTRQNIEKFKSEQLE